jgi:hypothetical protein
MGLFLAQQRQVEINHGGLQRAVSQVLLNEPEAHAGFE